MLYRLQEWTSRVIEHGIDSPVFFGAIFVFGLIAAIGSCCNAGVLAIVISYAGSEASADAKGSRLGVGFAFLFGNVISLSALGALVGMLSASVNAVVGQYWIPLAGVTTVYFGLLSLDMLPVHFKWKIKLSHRVSGIASKGFLFGMLLGGFATACSATCNPVFPLILGASYLKGDVFGAWISILVFAIGYSLPLGAVLTGVRFGTDRFSTSIANSKKTITAISGTLLVLFGFGLILGWV